MNRVKEIRLRKGIGLVRLAAMAGVSHPYLYDLERGNRNAKPETWERIAKALGVTVKEAKGENEDDEDGSSVEAV